MEISTILDRDNVVTKPYGHALLCDELDVYGEDFPSETFRVLKEKETRLYGEYRTKRLVLEAWERQAEGVLSWLVES